MAAAQIGMLVGEAGPLSTFAGVAIMAFVAGGLLYLLRDILVDWMHGAESSTSQYFEEKLDEEMAVTGTHEAIPVNHT